MLTREELLKETIKDVGEFIAEEFERRHKSHIRLKQDSTIVTKTDIEAESRIHRAISRHFPEDQFIGEESAEIESVKRDDAEYFWIVDPLDGTTNFANGIRHFCTSIAVWKNEGRELFPLLAGVYEPCTARLYFAETGKGFFLNEKSVAKVSKSKSKHSVAVTGLYDEDVFQDGRLKQLFNSCQSLRVTGAAALDLTFVAEGKFDIGWFGYLKPWDIAAAYLILQEAGASVQLSKPFSLTEPRKVLAGVGELVDQLQSSFI